MAARKATAKTTGKSVKRKTAPKKMVTKAVSKLPTIKEPLTKGGLIKAITDMTALAKKDVVATLDSLTTLIELHLKSRGPAKFIMPGLYKVVVVKKAAKAARKGINPFTGEEVMFKAKPARKVVKIKALKKLKEMAE